MQTISDSNLFSEIIEYAKESNNFSSIISQAESKYEIKAYRIDNISPEEAENIYWYIKQKYQTNSYRLMDSQWHQNERRIFVWFLVFYCKKFETQPEKMPHQQWERLSECFYNKNSVFLEYCGLNIYKGKSRSNWTPEQDQQLTELIQNIKVGKWNEVARKLFFVSNRKYFKTPKQCRERWFNHLDDSKKKKEWSLQQDKKLVTYVRDIGNKWAKIAKLLQNQRTQHMIKNRFHSLLRKHRKHRSQNERQVMKSLFQMFGLQEIEENNRNKQSTNSRIELEERSNEKLEERPNQIQKKQSKQNRRAQIAIEKKQEKLQSQRIALLDQAQLIKKNGFIQYQSVSDEQTPTRSDCDKYKKQGCKQDCKQEIETNKGCKSNQAIRQKQIRQKFYKMMVSFNELMRQHFLLPNN